MPNNLGGAFKAPLSEFHSAIMPRTHLAEAPALPSAETGLGDFPIISMDRAVSHFFEAVDPLYENIARYYNALPHPDKPPLSNLHIHFSATVITENYELDGSQIHLTTRGHFAYDGLGGKVAADHTPELPKKPDSPTIVIYLGGILYSAMLGSEYREQTIEALNEVLAHELAHYAQRPDLHGLQARLAKVKKASRETRSEATIFAIDALYGLIHDTRWARNGLTAATGAELLSFGTPGAAAVTGLAVAALTHAAGVKTRRTLVAQAKERDEVPDQYEKELEARTKDATFRKYQEKPTEADANHHAEHHTEHAHPALVSTSLRPYVVYTHLQSLVLPDSVDQKPEHYIANAAHRRLSLTPWVDVLARLQADSAAKQ